MNDRSHEALYRQRGRAAKYRALVREAGEQQAQELKTIQERLVNKQQLLMRMIEDTTREKEACSRRCQLCARLQAQACGLGHQRWRSRRCSDCWVNPDSFPLDGRAASRGSPQADTQACDSTKDDMFVNTSAHLQARLLQTSPAKRDEERNSWLDIGGDCPKTAGCRLLPQPRDVDASHVSSRPPLHAPKQRHPQEEYRWQSTLRDACANEVVYKPSRRSREQCTAVREQESGAQRLTRTQMRDVRTSLTAAWGDSTAQKPPASCTVGEAETVDGQRSERVDGYGACSKAARYAKRMEDLTIACQEAERQLVLASDLDSRVEALHLAGELREELARLRQLDRWHQKLDNTLLYRQRDAGLGKHPKVAKSRTHVQQPPPHASPTRHGIAAVLQQCRGSKQIPTLRTKATDRTDVVDWRRAPPALKFAHTEQWTVAGEYTPYHFSSDLARSRHAKVNDHRSKQRLEEEWEEAVLECEVD